MSLAPAGVMPPAVALVTGASSGIGAATARRLHAAGWTVVATARRQERLAALAEEGIRTLPLDLTDESSIEQLATIVEANLGAVAVLVNNAGYGCYGAMEDIPLAEARRQFEVNLFGLASLTQRLLPAMRAAGRGRIVNVSSMGGRIYAGMGSWYHASKHALEGWSDCLRLELAPFGLEVVVIRPGLIRTEFADVAFAPMLDRSGAGPYGSQARRLATALQQAYNSGRCSPPEVVAETILRACRSRRPRTRYAPGHFARPLLLARWLLPDRGFDGLVRSQLPPE
jgi:NAD(P)-dependent dehydrogenase (short-subunit alcohol dehydrogenase family)